MIFDDLSTFTKSYEEAKNRLAEETKNVMLPTIRRFLNEVPEFNAVTWTQYTPYFNDGDTCRFSVNEPKFLTGNDEADDDVYEGSFFSNLQPSEYELKEVANNGEYAEVYKRALAKWNLIVEQYGQERLDTILDLELQFSKWFNQLDYDAMLSAFGDHVRVTVTKNGINIDEYDHY